MRGRGLLARFWYLMPQSTLGARELEPPAVSAAVTDDYHERLTVLLNLPPFPPQTQSLEVSGDIGGNGGSCCVLSADARAVLWDFRRRLEVRLDQERGDLSDISDWVAKLPGGVARIACLLHLYDNGPSGIETPITAVTMRGAVAIGDYLISHATRALSLASGRTTSTEPAHAALRWIKRTDRRDFSQRDAQQALKHTSAFPNTDAVASALNQLVDLGYLRRRTDPSEAPQAGRPPSPAYEAHPSLLTRAAA